MLAGHGSIDGGAAAFTPGGDDYTFPPGTCAPTDAVIGSYANATPIYGNQERSNWDNALPEYPQLGPYPYFSGGSWEQAGGVSSEGNLQDRASAGDPYPPHDSGTFYNASFSTLPWDPEFTESASANFQLPPPSRDEGRLAGLSSLSKVTWSDILIGIRDPKQTSFTGHKAFLYHGGKKGGHQEIALKQSLGSLLPDDGASTPLVNESTFTLEPDTYALPSILMIPSTRGLYLTVLLLLAFCLSPVLALQANLAGVVDWHKPLVGIPILAPTPPRWVETGGQERIVGITEKNVLAVLDAETGDIAVLLLSGPSATTARLFSLSTGHLLWERAMLSDASTTHLTSPPHLGSNAVFTRDAVMILSDGRKVSKLGLDGSLLWEYESLEAGSTTMCKQILVSGDVVHILSLTSSFASTTLSHSALDFTSGQATSSFAHLPSSVSTPSDVVLSTSSVAGEAQVVWLEKGKIRSVIVAEKGTSGSTMELKTKKGNGYKELIDVGIREKGVVLGKTEEGVIHVIDVKTGLAVVSEFEGSEDSDEKSSSTYSAIGTATGIIVNRIYWSFKLGQAVAQTFSLSTAGTAITTGFTFAFDTASHGIILHSAVSPFVNARQLPSLMVSTSSGALQVVRQDLTPWTREESLSEIAGLKFVDLGEPEVEEVRDMMAEENPIGRLIRQLLELKELPSFFVRFVTRFLTASYSSAISTEPLSPSRLHRDQFGFQKLIVAVTKTGKVFAMDSANGGIVWSRNLGRFDESGSDLTVSDLWVVRERGEWGNPTLAVIAVKTRKEALTTIAYHIDAYTGEVSGEEDPLTGLPVGKELFDGRPGTAFLLPFENCGTKIRVLAIVDSSEKLHIFPKCKKVASDVLAISQKLFYETISAGTISGHIPSAASENITLLTTSLWTSTLPSGEILVSSSLVSGDTVAAFGRVTGDKSVIYKYLNPHLIVMTTIIPFTSVAHVYVVDITTGSRIYQAEIPDVVGDEVKAIMVENWLVYYWKEAKGWRLASVELYEDGEKGKIESSGLSTFSAEHTIKALSQTFIMPSGIKTMAFTTSRFGIAAKELVYVNSRNQLASLPRRLLDPRRPIGKPTSGDKEEMLIPYNALLPHDTRMVISHTNEILGAESIASSPALLESTSLLFVYGLDLYQTRGLTPSGTFDILSDSFNKVQLLLTLAGLSIGIFIAKPAVQRKMLRSKWY
ncbi:ER membrane protein complex subunit 1, partial [Tremellales sp. Uapishka_1]